MAQIRWDWIQDLETQCRSAVSTAKIRLLEPTHCFPGSTLAESWNQEGSWVFNPGTPKKGMGNSTSVLRDRLSVCPLCPFSIYLTLHIYHRYLCIQLLFLIALCWFIKCHGLWIICGTFGPWHLDCDFSLVCTTLFIHFFLWNRFLGAGSLGLGLWILS